MGATGSRQGRFAKGGAAALAVVAVLLPVGQASPDYAPGQPMRPAAGSFVSPPTLHPLLPPWALMLRGSSCTRRPPVPALGNCLGTPRADRANGAATAPVMSSGGGSRRKDSPPGQSGRGGTDRVPRVGSTAGRNRGGARRGGSRGGIGGRGGKRGTTLSDIVARKGDQGALAEGLKALQALIDRGSKINGRTFTMLMSICSEQIRLGYASLDDARRLMDVCTKCGVAHDTFLFNGLMSACAKAASRGEAALSDGSSVLQDMRDAGCEPDIITFNSLMDICAKAAGYKSEGGPMDGGSGVPITTMTGYSVLQLINDEGLSPNAITFATLMQLCAKCAARGRASVQDGLQVLDRARSAGVTPNLRVYNSLMDVVAKSAGNGAADTLDGLSVLKRVRDASLIPDTATYNSLIEVYACCAARGKASLSDALKVLQWMRADGVSRDAITYNTLVDLLAKETHSRGSARVAEGLGIIAVMKADAVQPQLQTYSALIDVCAKAAEHGTGDLGDADLVLERMKEEGILDLDKVICNSYLNCAKADGSAAALSAADKILDIMPTDQRDTYTYSCIIGLLAKTGELERARVMFKEAQGALPRLTSHVYNAAMSAELQQGDYDRVLDLWEEMKARRVGGDSVTMRHVGVAQEAIGDKRFGVSL